MLPRQRLQAIDYQEQLNRLVEDKRRFEAKLSKVSTGQKLEDLVEKYRAYIKDLLLRPDSKAATLCNSLQPLATRLAILKAQAFSILKVKDCESTPPQNHNGRNLNALVAMTGATKTKQKMLLLDAFRSIRDESRPVNKSHTIKSLVKTLHNIQLRHFQQFLIRLEIPSSVAYLRRQLREKDTRIHQLQAELAKISQPSKTLSENEQRLTALDKLLKEKEKDIKNLFKANKQLESKYEQKVEKLQEEVSKINVLNSKLMEELEELRQRRGEFSGIEAQPDNSMSMELFNQRESEKDLQVQLSEKYLRQVICLKQNIESIKANFLSLLQNNLKLQRSTMMNLLYLLNFNEDQKTIAKKNPLVSQLLQ